VNEARQTLEPDRPFVPAEVTRGFVVLATDYLLAVLGTAIDRILRDEAPRISLRFVPNSPEDAAALTGGGADLAVGIYGELPQEMRNRQLMTDRLVCVVRQDHPDVGKRLSLAQFVRLPHVQVAPRGKPGGYLDNVLRDRGLTRRVARAVPFFVSGLILAAQTDYVLTAPERIARSMAPALGLRLLEPPIELRPYALSLVWHPRFDGDAGHRFMRDVFARAAREVAGDAHPGAQTRLEPADPTSGQTRKRPRRRPR
jgi:DNA-binding transcriptional LysR family regulator